MFTKTTGVQQIDTAPSFVPVCLHTNVAWAAMCDYVRLTVTKPKL